MDKDVWLVLQWWAALFFVGSAAFPFTRMLFRNGFSGKSKIDTGGWFDNGYLFSKAVGMAIISYVVFFFGTLRILPFTIWTIWFSGIGLFVIGAGLRFRKRQHRQFTRLNVRDVMGAFVQREKNFFLVYFLEEALFLVALFFWAWVKAHEPTIEGLEKFMDFGFMQSLLNSRYFPAPDMWWAGGNINYYFFGHLVTSVITKLSGLDLFVTFNLMLATLFAMTFTMSFSIGVQLLRMTLPVSTGQKKQRFFLKHYGIPVIGGFLTAYLVSFAGNMQTLYAFTKGYVGENVVPFWTILWSREELWSTIGEGIQRYWYANATRFIPFTIHEFPSYSFVVSDVHGHVLSIPFALLAIALLILVVYRRILEKQASRTGSMQLVQFSRVFLTGSFLRILFFGFLLGVLLMTNALDGPIYFFLFLLFFLGSKELYDLVYYEYKQPFIALWYLILPVIIVSVVFILTALPFLWHFKSFAAGIGVNCPPGFLANSQIGLFIFEGTEKCQKSPFWMLWLLWGFFWYCGIWIFIKKLWIKVQTEPVVHRILKVFFLYGIFLIVVPEFFYVKDIYPAHFRSNTMFKLGYEAYMMWSIIAGYVISRFLFARHFQGSTMLVSASRNASIRNTGGNRMGYVQMLFLAVLLPQIFLVSMYPYFSVRSYFGELKTYKGIRGTEWLEKEYPDDWQVILWLRQQVEQQPSSELPVLVEADGESYTKYNHVSVFTGMPSVVGWAVHEWLWRGSYDVVGPRREDVKTIYTSKDPTVLEQLFAKYRVRYVLVGQLEREKYPNLSEETIASLGTLVFQSGTTRLYDVGKQEKLILDK